MFAFILAFDLGRPDPWQMLEEIDAVTLDYWRMFYEMGFPEMRAEMRSARTLYQQARIYSEKNASIDLEDYFLPTAWAGMIPEQLGSVNEAAQRTKAELQRANLLAWAQMNGAVIPSKN